MRTGADKGSALMPNGNRGLQGLPIPAEPWVYSDRLLLALRAAATMHAAQTRKGTGIPYLSHLLWTMRKASEV